VVPETFQVRLPRSIKYTQKPPEIGSPSDFDTSEEGRNAKCPPGVGESGRKTSPKENLVNLQVSSLSEIGVNRSRNPDVVPKFVLEPRESNALRKHLAKEVKPILVPE
jgi:hypothetical protein